MIKKVVLICLIVLIACGGGLLVYGAISDASIEAVSIALEAKKGTIGSFSAETPTDGAILNEIPSFKCTAAENADSYSL